MGWLANLFNPLWTVIKLLLRLALKAFGSIVSRYVSEIWQDVLELVRYYNTQTGLTNEEKYEHVFSLISTKIEQQKKGVIKEAVINFVIEFCVLLEKYFPSREVK